MVPWTKMMTFVTIDRTIWIIMTGLYARGEWYGFDAPEEYGVCCDSYRSDVPGDGTILNGTSFGGLFPCVMDAPVPDDTEVSDRSLSETPDLAGDLGKKTESPLSGFGKPNTGDIQFLHACSRA